VRTCYNAPHSQHYTLSLHDALPISYGGARNNRVHWYVGDSWRAHPRLTLNLGLRWVYEPGPSNPGLQRPKILDDFLPGLSRANRDRKSTRLNSSHGSISYAVFCLKK